MGLIRRPSLAAPPSLPRLTCFAGSLARPFRLAPACATISLWFASLLGDNMDSVDENFPSGKADTKADTMAHRNADDKSNTITDHKPSTFIPIPVPLPVPEPLLKPIEKTNGVTKRFRLWKNAKREEFCDPKNVQRVFKLAFEFGICTEDERYSPAH